MVNRARIASTFSRMAVSGLRRPAPTRPAMGSHQAPRPSITRLPPSGAGPASSCIVLQEAAITAGLRV